MSVRRYCPLEIARPFNLNIKPLTVEELADRFRGVPGGTVIGNGPGIEFQSRIEKKVRNFDKWLALTKPFNALKEQDVELCLFAELLVLEPIKDLRNEQASGSGEEGIYTDNGTATIVSSVRRDGRSKLGEGVIICLAYWGRNQHIEVLDKGQCRFEVKMEIVGYRCSLQYGREMVAVEVPRPSLGLLVVGGARLNS